MLEGDLSDFTLPEILKLLAFTSKTGRLHLRHEDTLGRVEVGAGRVQAASADAAHLPLARRLVGRGLLDTDTLQELIAGRDTLPTDLELAQALVDADADAAASVAQAVRAQSVDAVFDLLRWTEGHFRFAVEDVPTDGPLAVDHDLDDLLEQAQQRLERWADIHERTGPGDASVSVTSPADTSVEIDADAWQLIGLADGSRTIDELARLTGRGQFDTRSTLVELADRGLVALGTDERDGALERLLKAQATLGALEQRFAGTSNEGAQQHPATSGEGASKPAGPGTAIADHLEEAFAFDHLADTAVDDGASPADAPTSDADSDTSFADSATSGTDQPGTEASSDQSDTGDASADTEAADTEAAGTDQPVDDRTATARSTTSGPAAARPSNGSAARRPRLRTDPTVDPALVDRLIDGVRNLA